MLATGVANTILASIVMIVVIASTAVDVLKVFLSLTVFASTSIVILLVGVILMTLWSVLTLLL